MKPTVIHNNNNSGNNINNYSDPNANINPDIQQSHQPQQQQQQQQPQQHPPQQPQGIYDTNGLAGGANSRRFPFYPTGFDFFDDDELFSDGGVRSRLNRMRDPFGTWGRKRRSSQENITPQQTAQTGGVPQAPQTQQVPQPDEGYEDEFFPQMQPGWGADPTWGRGARKRNPNLDDDDDFFSYIPQQFRQYIPSNFQFPRMRSHFGRQQMPQPATNSPQNRNYFPQQQQQSPPQQQQPVQQEAMNRPKFCDAAMQTDADLLAQSQANDQGDQPNLNQHGLRNTIDMGQKANDEFDEAGPRARSAPPDPNYQNDPNNPNNFASAQSFSSAAGFPGQKPQVYAHATATPGAHAQAHAQAQTTNMGTNTGPGTPNSGNVYRQYYYPFDNNGPPPSSPPRQQSQQPQTPSTPQTPNQDGQFVRTVPIVIESRKVPAKPKPQPQQQQAPPQAQAQAPPQSQPRPQQQPPRQNSQPREIPIRVEHTKTQNQAPPAAQPPSSPQAAESEQPKTPAPHDSITKIQAIQKEVMDLMLAVEQFKGNGRNKDYMYLDEMLTRNLIKLDDIETDGKENIRLARKEAIKCIQASLCVLEMKADGRIPANESKPDDSENNPNELQQPTDKPAPEAIAQETKSPEDSTPIIADQEKTENVTDKKNDEKLETANSTTNDTQAPPPDTTETNTSVVNNKENEPENNKIDISAGSESTAANEIKQGAAVAVTAEEVAEVKPAESA